MHFDFPHPVEAQSPDDISTKFGMFASLPESISAYWLPGQIRLSLSVKKDLHLGCAGLY
jgi:hypothetical protein